MRASAAATALLTATVSATSMMAPVAWGERASNAARSASRRTVPVTTPPSARTTLAKARPRPLLTPVMNQRVGEAEEVTGGHRSWGQHHAEARVARHHPLKGFGRAGQRHGLDHRANAGQRGEAHGVLGFDARAARASGQGASAEHLIGVNGD